MRRSASPKLGNRASRTHSPRTQASNDDSSPSRTSTRRSPTGSPVMIARNDVPESTSTPRPAGGSRKAALTFSTRASGTRSPASTRTTAQTPAGGAALPLSSRAMPDEEGWRPFAGAWGVILGASSGFGAATARALGRRGMGIVGVHLDRKATLPLAEAVAADVRGAGSAAHFFNVNAADDERRVHVCDRVRELTEGRPIAVLLHSLAFGTLKPFVSDAPGQQTTKAQLEMTLDVMAHSLVYWVQDLAARGLLGEGSRIFAMTSAGGARVMPFYGAVSAAKAALESHVRQLAREL